MRSRQRRHVAEYIIKAWELFASHWIALTVFIFWQWKCTLLNSVFQRCPSVPRIHIQCKNTSPTCLPADQSYRSQTFIDFIQNKAQKVWSLLFVHYHKYRLPSNENRGCHPEITCCLELASRKLSSNSNWLVPSPKVWELWTITKSHRLEKLFF